MTDLRFAAEATWSGTGKKGEGKITMGQETVRYSVPVSMGGKGMGSSPEDLLVGAVTACYSGTLYAILAKKKLPVQHVMLRAEGIVTDYPEQMKFSRLIVHPTIVGGEKSQLSEYEQAAITARDKCFIGKTIVGNVTYEVGTVRITNVLLEQEKIDELVERFYNYLTKDAYFSSMFAERNVDINRLKNRQKIFISRMVNDDTPEIDQDNAKQVEERHKFHTTPERAKIWLDLLEKAVDDMQIPLEIKEPLMGKMNYLMDKIVKK